MTITITKEESRDRVFYEYISSISQLLFIYAIAYISIIWIISENLNFAIKVTVDDFFNLINSNKVLLLLFSLYFAGLYRILSEKIPRFLLPIDLNGKGKETKCDIILRFLKEILSNQLVLFLLLLIPVYYFILSIGERRTFLYLLASFLGIKIIGEVTSKTLELHNKTSHDYTLLQKLFKKPTRRYDISLPIFATSTYENGESKSSSHKLLDKVKELAIFLLKCAVSAALLIYIVKNIKTYVILLVIISIILAVLAIRALCYFRIEKLDFDTARYIYFFLIRPLINIFRIIPAIWIFLGMIYVSKYQWPFTVTLIVSLLIIWIGFLSLSSMTLLLILPKFANKILLVNNKVYENIFVLDDHKEYLSILDKNNRVIRLYKYNIIELK